MLPVHVTSIFGVKMGNRMSSSDDKKFFSEDELAADDLRNDPDALETAAHAKKAIAKPHWKTKTKHLGDLMSSVLEDVVARRSGMTIDLISAWGEIAGPNYAGFTRAEKINWPRQISDLDPFQPGTLVVACDPSKAIFFQHETSQILERLNLFFGFEAIGKIKIVQKSVVVATKIIRKVPDKLDEASEMKLSKVMSHIEDDELRKRLEKFGRAVLHNQSKNKE